MGISTASLGNLYQYFTNYISLENYFFFLPFPAGPLGPLTDSDSSSRAALGEGVPRPPLVGIASGDHICTDQTFKD